MALISLNLCTRVSLSSNFMGENSDCDWWITEPETVHRTASYSNTRQLFVICWCHGCFFFLFSTLEENSKCMHCISCHFPEIGNNNVYTYIVYMKNGRRKIWLITEKFSTVSQSFASIVCPVWEKLRPVDENIDDDDDDDDNQGKLANSLAHVFRHREHLQ